MKTVYFAAACAAALLTSAAAAAPATKPAEKARAMAAEPPRAFGAWGVDLSAGDPKVKPGDSFFERVNGAWYAKTQIPADRPMAGVGMDLFSLTQERLRTVIEEAAKAPKSPVGAKVGGLYTAYLDEARLEKLDAAPLAPDLARIKAATTRDQIAALMGASHAGFGASLFNVGVVPDAKHPGEEALTLLQGGLGLPDRDYYLVDRFAPQRAAYQAYIVRTLKAIAWPGDAEAEAKAIMDFETRVAQGSWSRVERRDPNKTYNAMSVAELQALTPGFDWAGHFKASGIANVDHVIVFEKTAFPKLAEAFTATPVETLQAWEAFHTADQAAPYLSKRFVDSKFELAKALTGQQTIRPRWERGVNVVNASLGEAVGQEYVARYFPPEAKAKAVELVGNLKAAMKARIEHAEWMSPSTKAEALKKLAALRVKVGYPNKWRDYSALKIDPTDLYGDVQRASAHAWRYEIGKLGKSVDREEWFMTPQTVDAYNNPRGNEIVFPAAMLQAPMFDPHADMAVNYGAIGGVIGHEITHGFDDQGRHFDSTGALRDWWTPEDAKRFETEAGKLAAQYDAFEPVPGAHINGKQTLGENIADMGGLTLGLDAYHASLKGKRAPVIDGLTGDQRVFLGWAQAWRDKVRDEATKAQLASDVHSPPRFRVDGPVRNIDAWYAAWGVGPDAKLYLKPADRARVW